MVEAHLTQGQSLTALKDEMCLKLVQFGIEHEESVVECEMMIVYVLGLTRASQLRERELAVDDGKLEQLNEMVDARRLRMPIQYILGEAYFMGLKLKIKPGVFIPRPDTETLVECVIEKLRVMKDSLQSGRGVSSRLKMLEIGVGSGAIAVSLLKNVVDLEVVAVDISSLALETTAENAAIHGVSEHLTLLQDERWWTLDNSFQLVVSNPPYIPRHQAKGLQPEVGLYEPELALFGTDEDGLGFYRCIAEQGKNVFAQSGALIAVEVGDNQAEEVTAIFQGAGFKNVERRRDLTGMDRVVCSEVLPGHA